MTTHIHSRAYTLLTALVAAAALLLMQAAPAYSDTDAARLEPPEALVKLTTDQVLARLKKDHDAMQKDPTRIYPLVEDLVLPHFDFVLMSRWVLGRHWRMATDEQREAFVDQFRSLLVRTYGKALLGYTDQKVEYLPLHAAADATDVVVQTKILQSGGPAIPINYSMHKEEGGWKVYDITIDGASLVTTYRSNYSSEIRREGLDALIARLKKLNAQGGDESAK